MLKSRSKIAIMNNYLLVRYKSRSGLLMLINYIDVFYIFKRWTHIYHIANEYYTKLFKPKSAYLAKILNS